MDFGRYLKIIPCKYARWSHKQFLLLLLLLSCIEIIHILVYIYIPPIYFFTYFLSPNRTLNQAIDGFKRAA